MVYEPRLYRKTASHVGLRYFQVEYLETDLWIGVNEKAFFPALPDELLKAVKDLRLSLDAYGLRQPMFLTSFSPVGLLPAAPPIARTMAEAAFRADVGPMAAVAGAFAQEIGELIQKQYGADEVIVENGGDIYLNIREDARVGIYAGKSPLSGRLALRIPALKMPLGICTSAGTVGPSVSLGNTDATVTLAASAALADAFASHLGNRVKTAADIEPALAAASQLAGLLGCLIIVGEQLGAWGEIELAGIE